jgi:hypothetical protein
MLNTQFPKDPTNMKNEANRNGNNEQRGLTSDYKRFPLPSSVKSLIAGG